MSLSGGGLLFERRESRVAHSARRSLGCSAEVCGYLGSTSVRGRPSNAGRGLGNATLSESAVRRSVDGVRLRFCYVLRRAFADSVLYCRLTQISHTVSHKERIYRYDI